MREKSPSARIHVVAERETFFAVLPAQALHPDENLGLIEVDCARSPGSGPFHEADKEKIRDHIDDESYRQSSKNINIEGIRRNKMRIACQKHAGSDDPDESRERNEKQFFIYFATGG